MPAAYGSATVRNRKSSARNRVFENEDRAAFHAHARTAAVIDGHGGPGCAQFLGEAALDALEDALRMHNVLSEREREEQKQGGEADTFSLVASGFMQAYAELEASFLKLSERSGDSSGACAVMSFVHRDVCYVANLGDCRLVYRALEGKRSIFGRQRPVVAATTDHRVDKPGEERDRVKMEGGVIRNGRIGALAPSRTIGDWDVKSTAAGSAVTALPDITAFSITGPTLIVMATDGVWDVLTNKRAMEIVEKSLKANPDDLNAAAEVLVNTAAKTSRDDVTAIVILAEP